MNAADPSGWRQEITEDMRKGKITEMFVELVRLSGESDRQKVWQSAAKFELNLWTQCTDRVTYWTKLEKKVAGLKKKPAPGAAAPQQAPAAASIPQQPTPAPYANQMGGAPNMQYNQTMMMQQAELLKKQQEQQQMAALNLARQQQAQHAQAIAAAQAQAQAKAAAEKQQLQEQQRLHALNLARQQQQVQLATARAAATAAPVVTPSAPLMAGQTQVLHQLQQQFQQQKQAVLTTQHNELQRLRQAQLVEQSHLSNLHSTQDTPPETRRMQLTQLQQQHILAQNKLSQEHKTKTEELLRRHQQILAAKLHANATPAPAAPAIPPQNQVTAAQVDAANAAQARARALARQNSLLQQNNAAAAATTTPAVAPVVAAPVAPAAPSVAPANAYGERLKQLKAKYWTDLELAQREFTRIAAQKPAAGATGPAAQQAIQNHERIKLFLQNIKRITTLLSQDPTKATTNNIDMLVKVEQHIERQVLPAMLRLVKKEEVKVELTKQPVPSKPATSLTVDTAPRQAAMQNAAQAEAVRQARELQAKKADQLKAEHAARQAAALKAERERKEAETKALADAMKLQINKDVVLTPAQRTSLEEQATRLGAQAKDLVNQQAQVTSPTSRATLGQQAILCRQDVARISHHLAQSKVAEARQRDKKFVSIVKPVAGAMSVTDRLLLAVKTYARDKPEVLAQAAPTFAALSLASGATVTTAFE